MKTVLITGASRGIGEATARRFAASGEWNIVLNCAHSEEKLEQLAGELRSILGKKPTGASVLLCMGDVADEAFVASMFRKTEQAFGGLDALINNAGQDWYGLLQDMKTEEFRRLMDTNLTGPFFCCREAIPLMLKKHSGTILNISSVWGEHGASCESAYAASKGALNALTRSLARELGPSGIYVNALSCGYMDTSMNDRFEKDEVNSLVEEIPLGRIGRAEEAAEEAYHLTAENTYITGQILTVDGGWMA